MSVQTFDSVWTVAGIGNERFVCFQLSDKNTFTVLRHFGNGADKHRDYTAYLNLLNGHGYGMRRRAGF